MDKCGPHCVGQRSRAMIGRLLWFASGSESEEGVGQQSGGAGGLSGQPAVLEPGPGGRADARRAAGSPGTCALHCSVWTLCLREQPPTAAHLAPWFTAAVSMRGWLWHPQLQRCSQLHRSFAAGRGRRADCGPAHPDRCGRRRPARPGDGCCALAGCRRQPDLRPTLPLPGETPIPVPLPGPH